MRSALEKFQVLKLKVFSFYSFLRQSHRGITFCTHPFVHSLHQHSVCDLHGKACELEGSFWRTCAMGWLFLYTTYSVRKLEGHTLPRIYKLIFTGIQNQTTYYTSSPFHTHIHEHRCTVHNNNNNNNNNNNIIIIRKSRAWSYSNLTRQDHLSVQELGYINIIIITTIIIVIIIKLQQIGQI